ncbi:ABC-three component system middle component 1 [Delftia sp. UME58]|uniref:ABC-three component system middle component 1 n=1 Tax=Delftia sp. UME58 TaxID=1862322 RepID=UPI0016025341|nr:ABC-three component system middle component 1 [Delftia sp. UME58]
MINGIINEALLAHGFKQESENDLTGFYVRESGAAIRFAILHKLNELPTPSELNAAVNQSVPASFLAHPAFKKNCDLICIHHLNKLAEFKSHEEQIFAIEEDPHFFKKYILYYSDTEEAAIQKYSYADLVKTISDKSQFSNYKNDPLAATQYSVAAKIFIKLPFLELPFTRRELVSLRLQASESVAEEGLDKTYAVIQKFTANGMDELIRELINDELENNAG